MTFKFILIQRHLPIFCKCIQVDVIKIAKLAVGYFRINVYPALIRISFHQATYV
jgi:hypothetical protein